MSECPSRVEHLEHVRSFPTECIERKISLNLEKSEFCQIEVNFAGFRLSSEGDSVDSSITKTVSDVSISTNVTDP